jgi:hypothetical protein
MADSVAKFRRRRPAREPRAPRGFTDQQREEWDLVIARLREMGTLAFVQRRRLVRHCRRRARCLDLQAECAQIERAIARLQALAPTLPDPDDQALLIECIHAHLERLVARGAVRLRLAYYSMKFVSSLPAPRG